MRLALTALYVLGFAVIALAAKAPTHHSMRGESMGNAHVAVVDDKEAIYYNYAGLSQINRLGNYSKRPEQGYYPRNFFGDARVNLGGAGPFENYFSTYNVAKDLQKLYQRVHKAAEDTGIDENELLMDTLSTHPELVHKINGYDHKYLTMKLKMDAELAVRGFGGAIWVDASVAPYLDGGLVLPFIGVDTFYVDAVIQGGFSIGFTNNFSVGMGLKAAKRHKVEVITVDILNYSSLQDTLDDRYHDAADHIFDSKSLSFGLDFGILYQLTREIRVGASLRDVYFKDLAGDTITPNLSVGINYSPRFFNKNTAYARKFNVACDFVDAINSEKNYKVLSHLNFGLEVEQTLLAWPGYNNEIRALSLRLAGGFKGGYPSAGVSLEVLHLVTFEFTTWAEELGYFTGQDEERIYMGQVSIGF